MKKLLYSCWLLLMVYLLPAQTPLSGIINHYASVSDIDYCNNQITVDDPSDFSVGTAILLIQMQGATINTNDNSSFGDITDLGSAGLFERTRILAINGTTLTLENALVNTYDLGGAVQIVDIPIFDNAEVIDSIEAMAWNGITGGILALEVTNTLTLSGKISADGKGFRGGVSDITQSNNCNFLTNANDYFYDANNWRGGAKGEGIAQVTQNREAGRGAQANGGGGGNDHNAGGGGGANSSSGGLGGQNNEPSTFGCDGNFPGLGGKGIAPEASRIYLGGGGGAGHENNNVGTDGGAGGGIIYIKAGTIEGNSQSISARGVAPGEDASGDGAGGGGAGGTILIDVTNVSNPLNINANGGSGGNVDNNNDNRCHGPGGGGSGGRVLISTTNNVTISASGGAAGRTLNSADCPDGTNGAQPGSDGRTEAFPTIPMGDMAPPAPGFVSQPQATSACIGQPVTISAEASGTDLQYQWQVNTGTGFQDISDGADYNGSQTENLTINSPDPAFQFRLQISNACANAPINSNAIQVTQFPVPMSDFDFMVNGLNAQFTNNSTDAESYIWDFGDGNSSAAVNPTHTYAMNGMYQVTLLAINACDTVSTMQTLNFQGAPPVADFSADTTEACAPFTVNFTNNSSPDATSFRWIFPGGMPLVTTDANPSITYQTAGVYNVILIATNASGSDTTAFANYITVNAAPTADFDFTNNEATVNFTSNATGADRLLWDFGDGNTSTATNPAHTFASDGDYTVTLSAVNDCDSVAVSQTVSVRTAPNAAFSANVTEGCPPFAVDFTNNSSDNATNFTWLFEGATPATSTARSPGVNYTSTGTYDVTLIATNEVGSDTLLLTDYITVLAAPRADYFFVRNGFTLNFTDNSRNADRLRWDFGDGNTSTETNPTHTYAGDGTYQVILSAINACDSVSFSQTITINTRPEALFSVGVQEGCAPFVVRFQNNSSDNAESFTWILPGATPATSTERNPRVTYNTAGTFDVTLIATNTSGSDTMTIENYIIVGTEPVANFTARKNNLTFTFTNNSRNGDTFTWNFGDGNGSSQMNPVHTYDLPGNYMVTLTISNDCGDATQTIRVTAGESPTASFSADRLGGCAPTLINFRNASRGVYENLTWEFPGGDPVLSSEENPTVRYNAPGVYDVILTINGPLGENRTVRTGFIEVLAAPGATFNVSTINGNTATFTSSSMNAPNLLWAFGDGNTSMEPNPTHTYARGGVYNVTLNASNAYCSRSVTQTISIGSTAVEDLRASGIDIFPNPVKNELFIQTEANSKTFEYRLFSIAGQALMNEQFIKNEAIDLSAYAKGTYLLQLRQADKIWVVKIVKQ